MAIFDETSFAKLEIEGPGAAEFLERLCDNRVARGVGQITYTQMLNRRGGIECDFTVARLGEERFSIVTGTAFGNHDREWMRRHLPPDGERADRRRHLAVGLLRDLGPAGPRRARPAHPGRPRQRGLPLHVAARDHDRQRPGAGAAGDLRRRARLGDLLPDRVRARPLADALGGGASRTACVAGGYRAIDSLRLEKGYRVWGADITPDETPYEGGVGFCVKLDKEGGFIGREALVEAKERGPRTRLRCLTLEDPRSIALGNEPVRVGGEIVGRVTTGGYGYTVERSIAYAYLPPESAEPGTAVEVEIFGRWVGGEVAAEPLFDPKGERIRA